MCKLFIDNFKIAMSTTVYSLLVVKVRRKIENFTTNAYVPKRI